MKKFLLILFVLVVGTPLVAYVAIKQLNSYQLDGEISFKTLDRAVTVHRDEIGIPYIFAESLADAIRAQGFITAQDRLFQTELYRVLIEGKLASVVGEAGKESDIQMLVLGIYQNAVRHAAMLDDESKEFLHWYAEGYNAFVETREHEYPVEFTLLGFQPRKITVTDLLAVQHFAGYVQSRNYQDEILSLQIAAELGLEKATQILPLNINPDRATPEQPTSTTDQEVAIQLQALSQADGFASDLPISLPALGSNNWVTGSTRSAGGVPILSNDPHLDASILPGPWYPVGLFTNDIQAIGANLPGVPGIMVGRTQHIAMGVTNAYGDSQDLYIEQVADGNPERYKNGNDELEFDIKTVPLLIKDSSAENGLRKEILTIRSTVRGPVISDHKVFGLESNTPFVLRTAAAEVTGNSIGLHKLLTAKTVQEADAAFAKIDLFYMNYLAADKLGGILHRPTGAIPERADGSIAKVPGVDDDWQGFIAKNEMPGQISPAKDWLGTSNHDVIPDAYPYYYSNHFSPNYRYLRTKEWMQQSEEKNASDHWALLQDVKNKHAERLMPLILSALSEKPEHAELHQQLAGWDFRDNTDAIGATVYHLIHEYLMRSILEDKLSSELTDKLLQKRYYWMQRFDKLILSDNSFWTNLSSTPEQETIADLILQAAGKARDRLESTMGGNPDSWRWGAFHKVSFVSPLRQSGMGAGFLGGGTHEANGSGETLNRGQYSLNQGPYRSQWFSSMRMVADLSDDKKIMASISGGNSARQFHPYFKSQLDGWLKEEWAPWWLDRESIEAHSQHKLRLTP